jgi:glycosyltransferase involved in cell wall biosynthesis
MPDLCLFSRRPFPGQFSIENVFAALLPAFSESLQVQQHILSKKSKGLLPRLMAGWNARMHQGKVNHITGDIYFIAPFLKKNRTLITVHDCDFILRTQGIKRWFLNFFWLQWPLRSARLITTISEATKKDILLLTSIAPEKIRVIPNPLTLVDDIQFREELSIEKTPLLLQIGTKANKNLDRLVPALKGLSVKLMVVGNLSDVQKQLLESNDVEYENRINISGSELIRLYQEADLLTFVSTREGFGLPIIEANALGCPVLTSNHSSMPEVANDAAFLVDAFSVESIRAGIVKLLEDASLREKLVEKGYKNAARFQPSNIADQYLKLYRELIQ